MAERVKDFFKVYIFANLETKNEILQGMKDRWQEQTGGSALFIYALERTNIDELRQTILEKVREREIFFAGLVFIHAGLMQITQFANLPTHSF